MYLYMYIYIESMVSVIAQFRIPLLSAPTFEIQHIGVRTLSIRNLEGNNKFRTLNYEGRKA